MDSRIRMFRGLGAALVMGVVTAAAMPVGAASGARVTHESYTMTGSLADAKWSAEGEDPGVGVPRALAVFGADATSVHKVPGSKPEVTRQPAGVAIALTMPAPTATSDPYPAELWCIADTFSFSLATDLSSAALSIPACEAKVLIDEDEDTGVTVDIQVEATWTATGPLESQKSHSRYTLGGSWTMDVTSSSTRPATADVTITGLPGGGFSRTIEGARLQTVKTATLLH